MKAVILCGGMGTRLREETEFRPKPMVEIGGRPVLWHILKTYSHFGIHDFILCLGYKGHVIKDYFRNYAVLNNDITVRLGSQRYVDVHTNGEEENWTITLANTGETTLKGARLKKIERYIGNEVFLATYGDGVANIDIGELLKFHKSHGKIATLTGVRPPSHFGELQVNNGRASLFVEKPQASAGTINGGFFVFNPEIFKYLSLDEDCDLERGPFEKLAQEGQLMVYDHRGEWACMDTFRDTQFLNKLWSEGHAFWKVW